MFSLFNSVLLDIDQNLLFFSFESDKYTFWMTIDYIDVYTSF